MSESFFSVAILAIALGVSVWISSAQCSSKWEASGFKTQWGPIKGCLISKDGAVWLPAENYREIP